MNNIKKITQKDRYGAMTSYEFNVPSLNEVPKPEGDHPGGPKGTDTVPAWLTPGENVVNAEASRLYQPMIDKMNDTGRAIQREQGGPIPDYASDGKKIPQYSAAGDFVNDDLLNRMSKVESNDNPNAVSGVGAGGQYQIMPATAAQPGYGVNPISDADRFDPMKSRQFAKEYLIGIAKANPDFTEDEVVTAYHSGAGNVRKAKSGVEELGVNGQEYAGKVNSAEVPPVQMASLSNNDLTNMYPNAQNYGSKTDGVPESEDGLGNQIMSKIGGNEFDWDKAFGGKEANPFNKEFYEEDGFGDLNQFERSVKYPMEIFGMDVPPNAVGKPTGTLYDQANPVIEALNPSVEKINEGISSNALRDIKPKITSAKNDLDYMTTLITNIKKNGGQPNSSQIEKYELALGKHKKLLAEEKKIQGINQTHKQALEKESNKNKDFTLENEKKIEIAKKVIQETNTADYAEGKSELDKADDEWAKKNLTGEYEGDFAQNLINKAKEYGGIVVDKSIEFFKNAFSSMFNGEELARMAMIYAGSRAMGYDHGGSLNYSMKNYIKRVDANLAAAKKFSLTDKAREDYTEASLKEYSKTGNRDVLVPKKANVSAIEFKGELFHRDFGKLGIVKLSNKQDGIRIPSYIARDLQRQGKIPKNADVSNGFDVGMNSPLIKGKTAKLNPSLHDATTMRKEFSTVAKTNLDAINAIETGSEKKKIQESPSEIANEAQSILTEHLRRFQIIDDNKASIFRREVDSSIADYYKALRKWSDNKNINGVDDEDNPKPTGIQGYFNKRVMILKTDGVIQPTDIAKTTPENLMKLERLILQTKGVRKDPERYISIWEEGLNTWNKMKSRGSYSKDLADPGWDGFTLWMYEMEQSGDIGDRAKKLIEPSNLK
jgi:hypothetical protein